MRNIVFEHLEQLASPNLDSHSQDSVFYLVETLYNTVVSARCDNVITVWLNDRQSLIFSSNLSNRKKLSYADYELSSDPEKFIDGKFNAWFKFWRARPWFVTHSDSAGSRLKKDHWCQKRLSSIKSLFCDL